MFFRAWRREQCLPVVPKSFWATLKVSEGGTLPPLCGPPPLVLPQGGVGDRHLVNPKRAKPPPKGAVQSFPVESGEHVQEFKVNPPLGKDKGRGTTKGGEGTTLSDLQGCPERLGHDR